MYSEKYEKFRDKINFINDYRKASNAATGSKYDSNANVEHKNICTCSGELVKGDKIGVNRLLMIDKITSMFGKELAEEYIRQIETHELYKHDETNIAPYTYAATEVVNVEYKGKIYTISFERLYELCEEEEILLDEEKNVWGKVPNSMYIEDKQGFVPVLRLIKKERHRDLVRVKNAFSNDVIVTDNHPIIISDSINDTIEAAKSQECKQYRCSSRVRFKGIKEINVEEILNKCKMTYQPIEHGFVAQAGVNSKWYSYPSTIKLDRDLGYFIGFFIGDGDYNLTDCYSNVSQKEPDVLYKLSDILYTHFSAAAPVSYSIEDEKYRLRCSNPVLFLFLKNMMGIKPKANCKSLPENIFEYTRDFAIGVIEGLIDSDGTVDGGGSYCIRLSSRTACLQIAQIVNALGITTGLSTQQTKFGCNNKVTQKYQLFGVRFREPSNPIFTNCYKSPKATPIIKGQKGGFDEWQTISNVEVIDNEPYLNMNEYIYDITTETHSFICNGLWVHNCVAITMYPFLLNGLKELGGVSKSPKHVESFAGEFINLIYAIAAQFAGAVASPEFLLYMDYFIRKDYGDDYIDHLDDCVTPPFAKNPKTLKAVIEGYFQQVVHSINQPAAARDYQSCFWNVSYFDKPYFNGMFGDFLFPDETEPVWETFNWLQKDFMIWLNKERLSYDLSFPVETVNLLNDGEKFIDEEWGDFQAEMYAQGASFFTYTSDSVDSLSSCCRLRNEVNENTFSFTLGAGGVSTGSKGVMTININRLVQNATRSGQDISEAVREQVQKVHKYLTAYNEIIWDSFNSNMLTVYKAGFIDLDKQYLTIGINGFVEGAEFLGIEISPNDAYFEYGEKILKPIYEENKKAKTQHLMFNTEFVPAESLGVKNAKWDKKNGYVVPRDCYNSYFYVVEDETTDILSKFELHGKKLTKYLDGGSAQHNNLAEHLTKEQYIILNKKAILEGCSYWTYNIKNTVCNKCDFRSKHTLEICPRCQSRDLDYITRIIGYTKRISSFAEPRQVEESKRHYDKNYYGRYEKS